MANRGSKHIYFLQTTIKLGYKDHGYNKFTAIKNKTHRYFWSQMASLQDKHSQLL